MATMKELRVLTAALDAALETYRDPVLQETGRPGEIAAAAREVKRRRAELQHALVGGCLPCPRCGSTPLAVVHEQARTVTIEIGCVPCEDHRAFGPTPVDAAEAWMDGAQAYPANGAQLPALDVDLPASWVATWPASGKASKAAHDAKRGAR